MMAVASLYILSMIQLLLEPVIGVQRFASVSQKLSEGGKFDDVSGVTFDDASATGFDHRSGVTLDEKSDGGFNDKSVGLSDDKSVEKFDEYFGRKLDGKSRVTVYDDAEWFALGKMNKLGVTRYKKNAIAKKKREDGKFFWPDSVNREGAELYSGAQDLTESVAWGWHHPTGLYGTIPVGGPLIDADMNIYLGADDAIRKFDVSGTLLWSYAPRGQLAAAPTLCTGCAPRLSAATVDDISAEEEELLRPDWVKGNGSDIEHSVQFFQDFKIGDLVKVKAGTSYRADGRELYTAGDQARISGVAPDDNGKYDIVLIEWTRTGGKSAVKFDTMKKHFVRLEPRMSATSCTPVLIGSTTSGYVFAIALATGHEVWAVQGTAQIAGVKGALACKNEIVVLATNRCTDRYCYRYRNQTNPLTPGNTVVRGLNPATGVEVWNYVPEAPVWNMNPVFTDDDNVVFNDQEGRVYCLGLSTGTEVWKNGGLLGTYTEAAAVYNSGHHVVIGLGMQQYDANLPHRAYNTASQAGCNPYIAPGILPRCGNAAFRSGMISAYNASSGHLRWEKTTPHPPASAAMGRYGGPTGNIRLVVTLGHNCASASPTAFWMMDPDSGHTHFSTDGPTLWSRMCAGDFEGGDVRRAMGGRATCNPGSWSAPVMDANGDVYVGNQVGVYQRWGSPTELLSSLVTGVAFQDMATALADGIMAVATCTSLIVFQSGTNDFSGHFENETWSDPAHGYPSGFNETSIIYSR